MAVEFALIAPLVFLLLTLIIDFARIGYVQLSINSAARESVRASSFGMSSTEIESIANSSSSGAARMAQISSSAKLAVQTIRSCNASSTLGRTTEIKVETTFDWITPVELMDMVSSDGSQVQNMTLASKGVMVCAG